MGDNLVVSTHQSPFLSDAFTKPIDGKLISVICGEDGKIQVSWCEADKENGKLPYDQQTLHSVAVSRPSVGSGAWTMVETEGFQYIKTELGLGFDVDDGTGIAIDGAMGVAGLVSTPVSIASIINGIAGSITGSFNEEKVYDKGVDIAKQGSVLNMFNLYCVSSVVEEREKEVGRNYSLYPSYQELDSAQISTQECIDNFNKNFGEEGIFYGIANDMGFTRPLSMQILLSEDGFEKTKIMLDKWDEYAKKSEKKVDDVTANLFGKEK